MNETSPAQLPAYYCFARPELTQLVTASGLRILEVGCAAGAMGAALLEKGALEVVGVDIHEPALAVARTRLTAAHRFDLNALPELPYPDGHFDLMTFADVLEHLADPGRVLQHLARWLRPDGAILVSLPNVRHATVIMPLLVDGDWDYSESGVLDRTHLRFFTRQSMVRLLDSTGFEVRGRIAGSQTERPRDVERVAELVGSLGGDAAKFLEESDVLQFITFAMRKGQAKPVAEMGVGRPSTRDDAEEMDPGSASADPWQGSRAIRVLLAAELGSPPNSLAAVLTTVVEQLGARQDVTVGVALPREHIDPIHPEIQALPATLDADLLLIARPASPEGWKQVLRGASLVVSTGAATDLIESARQMRVPIHDVAADEQLGLAAAPRRSAPPPVTIVIPVWNKVEYTRNCLESLIRNTPGELFEVVIVDNASTDATPEFLAALDGDVQVIRNAENVGFVGACNQGAAVARGKYLLFLNNDTAPQENWLTALVETLEGDGSIGAAGARLVYPDGKLQEAGGIIFSDGSGWNFGRSDNPFNPKYEQACEVDYCSGAALLVRRDLFDKLGGFDARYAPAYYEDTDLCFGIRSLGHKVVYCPGSIVVHHEGVTAGTDLASGMKKYQVENRTKFVEKWRDVLSEQELPPEVSGDLPTTADRSRLRRTPNEPAGDGPSVLVVDPFMPLHDHASGSLRLFRLLQLMRTMGFRVTYIGRNGNRQERYRRELEAMGIEAYAGDPDRMAELGYQSDAPRVDLPALLARRRFDVAWLSFWYIGEQYLPAIRLNSPATRIVIDTVDVHFLRERRQAELEGQLGKMRKELKEKKRRELAVYGQADTVVTVTEADAETLRRRGVRTPLSVIPNVHPRADAPSPPFDARHGLLFVGNFAHTPNVDAIRWFCSDVLPRVRESLPGVRLLVVGGSAPEEVRALASESIVVTGQVPAVEPYLDSCRVSIAPLRYGAGMKGKVGEALGRGLPVVTTRIGAEGMGLVDREHVLVADDPEALAAAVVELHSDRALWERLSAAGKAHVEACYGPAAVGDALERILAPATARPVLGSRSVLVPRSEGDRSMSNHADDSLDAWLDRNRSRVGDPFHVLVGMLRHARRDCRDFAPITKGEYDAHFRARTSGSGLPFQSPPPPELPLELSIEQFVNAYDAAHLDRMVRHHLLGLVRHIIGSRGRCDLLDYGTGPTCGLFGAAHRELHAQAGVDTSRVHFVGIDKHLTPKDPVFRHAVTRRVDLLELEVAEPFDLVTSHHVLEHCMDWRAVIRKTHRLLRPGGHAYLSYPTFGGFYDATYRLMTRNDHVATYTNDEILEFAGQEGFDVALSAPYVDPASRFNWLPAVNEAVSAELQSHFYDQCVHVGLRTRMFMHHYGHYVVLRKQGRTPEA